MKLRNNSSGLISSVIARLFPLLPRPALFFLYTTAAIFLVVDTFRWPILWDGQVLHYINFLMAHGLAPYREIYDINLPGAYLIDCWQMHIFGPGDLAWRFYDFFLLGCMILAMMAIAYPYDWLAGFMAGVLFAIFHATEGPNNSAQRDEILTILVLAGYAFLFQAIRSQRTWPVLLSGTCMGLAVSIKPTAAPLALVLFLMTLYVLKKEKKPVVGYIAFAVIGFSLPLIAVLSFLVRHRAVASFFEIVRNQTAFYATLMPATKPALLFSSLPLSVFVLLPFGLSAALLNHNRAVWERWAIWLGIAFGFVSYCVQNKGFKYHRYPFLAFLLLFLCMELLQATQGQKLWSRAIGWTGLLFASVVVLPWNINRIHTFRYSDEYALNLQDDLTKLGANNLQRQVQCLDMVDGCFSALYRLGLVQNTGFTGDTIFFPPQSAPAVEHYRQIFWQGLQTNPPKIIVLSNEWFNWPRGFDKINRWPEFANYLNNFYTPIQTRTFRESAYRIYQRRAIE